MQGLVQGTRLAVAAASRAALNAKRGPLARLPDYRHHLLAQVRPQRLRSQLESFQRVRTSKSNCGAPTRAALDAEGGPMAWLLDG